MSAHMISLVATVRSSFSRAVQASGNKDPEYMFFHREDLVAWCVFGCAIAVIVIFDLFVLNRSRQALTLVKAAFYTMFWIFCAWIFCGWVYTYKGPDAAWSWMSGYLLECMLSFDNLFVFHLIFSVYGTPDRLKHKTLYCGMCGAVFFRFVFLFTGEVLMHTFWVMHFVFGTFLVYTGIKTLTADDDDDPSQHWAMVWLSQNVPLINAYDANGNVFVRVPVNTRGEAALPDGGRGGAETDALLRSGAGASRYPVVDFSAVGSQVSTRQGQAVQTAGRATMLFLVVVGLVVSDVLFAVNSVSAIVAQVNDLFLAYTSAVFAMLGLRAMFFIIDVLVRLCSLLKFGVAAVLVSIGMKLIIGKFVHVPPGAVCIMLVLALSSSMVASVTKLEMERRAHMKAAPGVITKMSHSPVPKKATSRPVANTNV